MMTIRDERREAAIERMADHLLAHGMAGASLRPLAAAAGTSDRMLLYYFKDRDELLAMTLERVAMRLIARLDAAFEPGIRLGFAPLLRAVRRSVQSPPVEPFMQLWLELCAGAARGVEPHRAIARDLMGGFAVWVASHLDAPDDMRAGQAALLLAMVEGLEVLGATGRSDLVAAAIDAFERDQPG